MNAIIGTKSTHVIHEFERIEYAVGEAQRRPVALAVVALELVATDASLSSIAFLNGSQS